MPLAQKLITWYRKNKRDLPWRKTKDPYKIWVSEIMLQQTQVSRGIEYFNRFIERFPDVKVLAEANEDEILKYWQGLGYYSRARNLHHTAKVIANTHNTVFPEDYKILLSMKGIGTYTASAIMSFSFNKPYPALDGNVYRVLTRYFNITEAIDTPAGQKVIQEYAYQVMDKKNPGEFNQAIMEFGALQCIPGKPDCAKCPLNMECEALHTGKITEIPVKTGKQKQKTRFFHYVHIIQGEDTYIQKRRKKDIWQHLYEFPLIETPDPINREKLTQSPGWKNFFNAYDDIHMTGYSMLYKHILTHQIINACFYTFKVPQYFKPKGRDLLRIKNEALENYAISKLMEKYLSDFEKNRFKC
jgi:A/G-specific adenine glycosylase